MSRTGTRLFLLVMTKADATTDDRERSNDRKSAVEKMSHKIMEEAESGRIMELEVLERHEGGDFAQTDMQQLPDEDLLIGLDADDLAYSSDCDAEEELAAKTATGYEDIFLVAGAEEGLTGVLPSSQPSEKLLESSQASQPMHPTPTTAQKASAFKSATGAVLAPMSEAAKQKAAELFDDFATPRRSNLMTAGGSTLAPVSEATKRKAEDLLGAPETATPKRPHLATAEGHALPAISEAAKQQAEAMFNVVSATSGSPNSQGFITASGKPFSPSNDGKQDASAGVCEPSLGIASSPSRQIQAGGSFVSPLRTKTAEITGDEYDNVFADDDLFATDAMDALSPVESLPEHIPVVVTFKSAGKKALKRPGPAALQKAHRIVEEIENEIDKDALLSPLVPLDELRTTATPVTLAETSIPEITAVPEQVANGTPFRPASQSLYRLGTPARSVARGRTAFATPRPVTLASPVPSRTGVAATNNTPIRLPLQVTTNLGRPVTPMAGLKTPLSQMAFQSPVRRVGLGVTPRAKRGGRGGSSFTVPFLQGRGGPSTPTQPCSLRSVPPAAPVRTYSPAPVFDLQAAGPRLDMKQSFFHPHHYDEAELLERGVPSEILEIDIYNAEYYAFQVGGVNQSAATAYETLHSTGCPLLSQPWVTNHWRLILWKLAAQVRARPQVLKEKWSFAEVVRQLKYRYEREYNHAQRSCIKRIQERDAAAGMPMHLCVAAIHMPQANAIREQADPPSLPVLELTDGWYRIKCSTDAALGEAIKKGRLRVGYKLAVTGARLDSAGEGREVLEALDKSYLLISGNSTSLARWHVKLGQQPKPFIATIRSLTPTGGAVSLMDIRVTRVFPLAFVDSAKGSTTGPWSADEELQLQDQWERNYNDESVRLHGELNSRLEKLEDLVQNLMSSMSDAPREMNSEPPSDLEDRFEALVESKNAHAALRQCSSDEIAHLAQYARSFLESERSSGADDVLQELKSLCPPRNVRNFRIIRFDDAQEYCRRIRTRTAQLNVWDAQALGDDAIVEGCRYLISNVIPGQLSSWTSANATSSTGEIYLHTRRDTRWQLVE